MKIFKELLPFLRQRARLYTRPINKAKTGKTSRQIPIIVSLTTIPSRIESVHLTIRSMLLQKSPPKKIWLWLHEDMKSLIPQNLKKLEGEVFEIHYGTYDAPHLKLIGSIEKATGLPIVTIDDDQIYPPNLLDILYQSHLLKPGHIISCTARQITFDQNKEPLPYQKWPYVKTPGQEATFLLPLGVFGVLYPPGCFDPRVTDTGLIAQLAPKADDLWFKALSLLEGTQVAIANQIPKEPTMILGTQEITLKAQNISQDQNRLQWKNLMDFFKIKPL